MNKVLENLKRKDFTLVFESNGTSFLFEDLTATYYMRSVGESLTMSLKTKRVFDENKTLQKVKEEGPMRTSEQTRHQIAILDSIMEHIEMQSVLLKEKLRLRKEDVANTLELLGSAFTAYVYFDAWYWDRVVEKNDPESKENTRLVQEYKNIVRARFEPACFNSDSYLYTLLAKLQAQFSVSVRDLEWYREKEILDLFDGNFLSSLEIEKRKQSFLFYIDLDQNIFLEVGEPSKTFIERFDVLVQEDVTELKGICANLGVKVTGSVRIVKRDYGDSAATQKRIHDMQQGEVLVSDTTDPELIPAFRKAAAVITDIGGLLSHAAITSRELGLPCIIGTNIATQVLKDGDVVEVDAEKGIVRKLS